MPLMQCSNAKQRMRVPKCFVQAVQRGTLAVLNNSARIQQYSVLTVGGRRYVRRSSYHTHNVKQALRTGSSSLDSTAVYGAQFRKMSVNTPPIPQASLDSFADYLQRSTRILALCGAGLSAASGLPTFRGAGGYWRARDAVSLATVHAFMENPSLVWQFYSYRRHMSLLAQPNRAHFALAELARHRPEFLTVTQNVDGLSPRANHPATQLELLHGSLSTVKCASAACKYVEYNNFVDPIVPALQIPTETAEGQPVELDISSAQVPLRDVAVEDLPHCPRCKHALLRPGVVWFGETLPLDTIERVEKFINDPRGIDLMIVVGTSARVHPAAGYIQQARDKGARVAVINTEPPDSEASQLFEGDWFFQGDAGLAVPQIFKGVIGDTYPSL